MLQFFRDELAAAGIQDRYQHDLYCEQGVLQLQDFLTGFRRAPAPKVLHTEEFFDVKVGEIKVVGRIDRIDEAAGGGVVITDYKTGKAQSQEDSDESLQLSIYALAAREKWGYRADHLVLYNLEGNSPVVTRRNEFQLNEARSRVMRSRGKYRGREVRSQARLLLPILRLSQSLSRHGKTAAGTLPQNKPRTRNQKPCHPERSGCFAKRSSRVVEGSL